MCDAHAHVYGLLFDRLHASFAAETLWWPYEAATKSHMRTRVDPIADKKVSDTYPLLPICGCMRTTFAEFEDNLTADCQYDDLDIPLKRPFTSK